MPPIIEKSKNAKRILILEDDLTLLRLLTSYLQDQGHFVRATDESQEALRIIDEEPWDLIITDGVLKTCYGEDFAAQVAARKSKIPVVLVTGSIRSVKDPTLFQGVLHKPFGRSDFSRFIETALDHSTGASRGKKAA